MTRRTILLRSVPGTEKDARRQLHINSTISPNIPTKVLLQLRVLNANGIPVTWRILQWLSRYRAWGNWPSRGLVGRAATSLGTSWVYASSQIPPWLETVMGGHEKISWSIWRRSTPTSETIPPCLNLRAHNFQLRVCIDATRISDGRPVMLKNLPVEEGPYELEINRLFSTEPLASNPRNHCAPLLDVIQLPNESPIMVHSLLRPFNNPRFQTFGEFVSFFSQVCEVSLTFL